MSNYYHTVDIDTTGSLAIDLKDYLLSDPYREGEHAIYLPEAGGIWTVDPYLLFTQEFVEYCEQDLGFKLDIAQIFMRKPYYQHPGAHVDISKDYTIHGGGINWTLDPDDAKMVWYEYPDSKPTINQRSPTDINWEWPLDVLTEADRTIIGQTPTLVRTDVPHTVNMGAQERWLVSLRTLDAKSWVQHLDLFKGMIN